MANHLHFSQRLTDLLASPNINLNDFKYYAMVNFDETKLITCSLQFSKQNVENRQNSSLVHGCNGNTLGQCEASPLSFILVTLQVYSIILTKTCSTVMNE